MRRAGIPLSLFAVVALTHPACHAADAKDESLPGDRMVRANLKEDVERIGEGVLGGIRSAADWERIRPELSRQYLDMLGLEPMPEKTPLKAQTTGVVEREGFRVEKVAFQSRPGLYVTANLYLPKRAEGKLPAVLYLCGHSGRGRDGNKTAFQHHGMWFATHGYACLIVDSLQLGEVAGIHHGTYRYNRWWWQSRGYTPAGVECWNGIRALDYLESRPEVDPGRIAATGISGGGAATFWIAAADPRVKAAIPVSGMGDLETYVVDRVIDGHCDCMMLVNAHRWEWTTIAALIAPRPVLFANSDHDEIFPMPGNERIARRLGKLYVTLGRPEAFSTVVVPGGHDDKPALRLAAYKWIHRWLKGEDGEVTEPELPKIDGKELRVFPDALPADALNDRIDETFVALGEPGIPKGSDGFGPWRDGLLERLRARCFAAPEAEILGPKFEVSKLPDDTHTIWILVQGLGETDKDWTKPHVADRKLIVFEPRGVGGSAWTVRPPHTIARSMALLGRTVDGGRVWDVAIAAARAHAKSPHKNPIGVIGRGPAGTIAALAALLEPSIQKVTVIDPPSSFREGPTILNVLRVCDVPEVLGMLAPKILTLRADEETVKRVEAIYKAAGASDKLTIKK
jgi:cephalosporin-C deacetylase-like acetyl esterase